MNQKRNSNRDPFFLFTKSLVDSATSVLKGVEKDRVPTSARISFWNSVFTDNQYSIETSIRQVLVDILRRHTIQVTSVQRFCFEFATLFIDLPGDFNKIISCLPYPYIIALHIAFRTMNDLIEYPPKESLRVFIEKASEELQGQKQQQFQVQVDHLRTESPNVERIIHKIHNILSIKTFDMFLQVLPPYLRLHFSLKYGRPYPNIRVNFENMKLPPDFVQAIADIEGIGAATDLIAWSENAKMPQKLIPEGI